MRKSWDGDLFERKDEVCSMAQKEKGKKMKKFTDSNTFSLLVILIIVVCLTIGASRLLKSVGMATVTKATEFILPERAFLGINYDFVPQVGVRVFQVVPGTPAEISGIKRGDIIRQIDGLDVLLLEDIARSIKVKRPGDAIRLKILRNKKILEVSATLIVRSPKK